MLIGLGLQLKINIYVLDHRRPKQNILVQPEIHAPSWIFNVVHHVVLD